MANIERDHRIPWCWLCNGYHERWIICRDKLKIPPAYVVVVPVKL